MFNIDISPLGKLAAEANKKNFVEYKSYITKILEYVEDKIEPMKTRILGTSTKPTLGERKNIER